MAASSSSSLRMSLNTARTILKTKKTIETKKSFEFSLFSCTLESLPNLKEIPLIDHSSLEKVFRKCAVEIIKRSKNSKLEVASGAIFAGAGVCMKELGMVELFDWSVFREREYQKAPFYIRPSSPWTMGEASSDFINCGRDSGNALLGNVKWDEKGLAVAIVQDADTREVLMQTVVNREILATNISSRKATFYNQWPLSLLAEGEIPSNFNIHDIKLSCNGDSLVYIGKPDGPTCHTCSGTCYNISLLDSFNNQR